MDMPILQNRQKNEYERPNYRHHTTNYAAIPSAPIRGTKALMGSVAGGLDVSSSVFCVLV